MWRQCTWLLWLTVDKPSWKNTYNTGVVPYDMAMAVAWSRASKAGYPFVAWEGNVYITDYDVPFDKCKVMTIEEMERSNAG